MSDVRPRSRSRNDAFFPSTIVTRLALYHLKVVQLGLVGIDISRFACCRAYVNPAAENTAAPGFLRIAGTGSHNRRHRFSGAVAIPLFRCCAGSLRWRESGVRTNGRRLIPGPHAPACNIPGSRFVPLLDARLHPGFAEFSAIAHGLIAPALLRIRRRRQQSHDKGKYCDPHEPAKNGGIMIPVPVQKNRAYITR